MDRLTQIKIIFAACATITVVSAAAIFTAGPAEQPQNASQTVEKGYRIGEYQGNVAVYEEGSSTPLTVYDVPVSVLPEADVAALEKGIPVQTARELALAIEDYIS